MHKLLQAALRYQEMGFSVIPVQKKNKKPYIAWENHQKEKAGVDLIKEWWEKYPTANVAIVTGELSGINVVDIDSQSAMEEIDKFLPDSLITPTANTPRGGRHYYHQSMNGMGNAIGFLDHCDFKGNGGYIIAPPSVGENNKPYAWLPSLSIFDVGPAPLPVDVIKAIKSVIKDTNLSDGKPINFSKGARDDTLFNTALTLLKGAMPVAEVQQVILSLAANCKPPFPPKEALIKVESALQHLQKGERNLTQEIRNWLNGAVGEFQTRNIFDELDVSKQDKAHVSQILTRLVSEDLLERTTKMGTFRIVDKDCLAINWKNTDIETFNINWPLEVESLAQIYNKNIVVLAGETDAGKTAYLLNVVNMNRDKEIFYFSSEMGENEFADRIDGFEGAQTNWNHLHLFERSGDFADVIKPDHINIIDHLELTDAFYKVAGAIGKIFDKLNKGIAIIGLQMDEGAKFGRGRAFSMEKARLYMTMSKNPPDGAILRILKAKKRTNPNVNPNNQRCNFKIVNGTRLIQSEPWYYDLKKEGKN